jgi:hypothetical protein
MMMKAELLGGKISYFEKHGFGRAVIRCTQFVIPSGAG